MNIEYKSGPKDGHRRVLPLGRFVSTVIATHRGKDYVYRRTRRYTEDGLRIYQYVGVSNEVKAIQLV